MMSALSPSPIPIQTPRSAGSVTNEYRSARTIHGSRRTALP